MASHTALSCLVVFHVQTYSQKNTLAHFRRGDTTVSPRHLFVLSVAPPCFLRPRAPAACGAWARCARARGCGGELGAARLPTRSIKGRARPQPGHRQVRRRHYCRVPPLPNDVLLPPSPSPPPPCPPLFLVHTPASPQAQPPSPSPPPPSPPPLYRHSSASLSVSFLRLVRRHHHIAVCAWPLADISLTHSTRQRASEPESAASRSPVCESACLRHARRADALHRWSRVLVLESRARTLMLLAARSHDSTFCVVSSLVLSSLVRTSDVPLSTWHLDLPGRCCAAL
jgi:hypothetical protein